MPVRLGIGYYYLPRPSMPEGISVVSRWNRWRQSADVPSTFPDPAPFANNERRRWCDPGTPN